MQAGLDRACRDAGRADRPLLVAISKTHAADSIRPLIAVGQRHFGENRVQEAQAKWPVLQAETPGIMLHLVGQLQSNKAAEAIALFDVIHSVDRASLVAALAKAQNATAGVISAEANKVKSTHPQPKPYSCSRSIKASSSRKLACCVV